MDISLKSLEEALLIRRQIGTLEKRLASLLGTALSRSALLVLVELVETAGCTVPAWLQRLQSDVANYVAILLRQTATKLRQTPI